jgi:hypothetical protein
MFERSDSPKHIGTGSFGYRVDGILIGGIRHRYGEVALSILSDR